MRLQDSPSYYRLKSATLGIIRHGRPVLWPRGPVGLGNYLYFWLHCSLQEPGRSSRVLLNERIGPWRPYFPLPFRRWSLRRSEVRVTDRREPIPWHFFQRYGDDFDEQTLQQFIESLFPAAGNPLFQRSEDLETLTINVRRGDYYSREDYRSAFGFNQVDYIRRTIFDARQEYGISRCLFVSDDVDWCRSTFTEPKQGLEFDFPDHRDPADDFRAVAQARHLVITNSTFSYWAAYLGTIRYSGEVHTVRVPAFHNRRLNGGEAWQLLPRWVAYDVT